MALQVIGTGFGRTGTTSLKAALVQLGFSKCRHMEEVMRSGSQVRLLAGSCGWRQSGLGRGLRRLLLYLEDGTPTQVPVLS